MLRIALKVIISALIITGISESAKRFTTFGAILASLPLTSILAFIWLYLDTKNAEKVGQLSFSIFWMVLPSLSFFIILPLLLKLNLQFWISIILSSLFTALIYLLYINLLKKFGIQF